MPECIRQSVDDHELDTDWPVLSIHGGSKNHKHIIVQPETAFDKIIDDGVAAHRRQIS